MTNFERFKEFSSSLESLAVYLGSLDVCPPPHFGDNICHFPVNDPLPRCSRCWKQWLEEEEA